MQIINKFRNPINWIIGITIKLVIRKIFFSKIENKDFNKLFSYILELLPNETIINILKLLKNTFKSKPSDLFKTQILNEAMIHTLPLESRLEIIKTENKNIKYLFIFLILGNIFKRSIFLLKNIILMPFKLGVYSFIAYLFGIKVDWLLSFFDIFKFNLPSWTYSKLLDLHISWMSWIKEKLQINSITTELEKPISLPRIKRTSIPINQENLEVEVETQPNTYLYLTKTQWMYLGISIITILVAYLGFTGGIPFSKTLEWNSDNRDDNDPSNDNSSGGLKGKRSLRTQDINPRGLDFPINENLNNNLNNEQNTWQDSFTSLTRSIIDKIKKPFNWFRSETIEDHHPEELSFWKKRQEEAERLWRERLAYWESKDVDSEVKTGQLEKKGSLGELDREEVRKEYKENKNSSPTHPDPESAKDMNRLFPYSSKPEEGISMHQRNDSTDTITQETFKPKSRIIKASDDYLKENDQNIEERHTYPPRPSSIKPRRRALLTPPFSSLSGTPFARGVIEKLDTSKPQPIPEPPVAESNPSVEIERGSILMSARFLDNFRDEWKD